MKSTSLLYKDSEHNDDEYTELVIDFNIGQVALSNLSEDKIYIAVIKVLTESGYSVTSVPYEFIVDNNSGILEILIPDTPVDVYSLNGVLLERNITAQEFLTNHPAGIYIVGNHKVAIR